MDDARAAVDRLEAWAAASKADLGWERVEAGGSPALAFDVAEPHAALLLAVDGSWDLVLLTVKGSTRSTLETFDAMPEAVLDAVMFAVFTKATSQLEHRDRSASVALSTLLRQLAGELDDKRYGGRAATLLAGHAIKDGYRLQASSRLEEAIALFDAAGDVTAADAARAALANLPELMTSA